MTIAPKPAACCVCPLNDSGVGFVPDAINGGALFEIRGERPWKHELAFGQPFAGQAGFVLKQWGMSAVPALKLALDRQQVDLTNTLRCLPQSLGLDSYPRKKAVRLAAEQHCRRYNASVAPAVILCGEHAQRAEFGAELDAEDAVDRAAGRDVKGVMGRIGREYKRGGRRYVFAPHPSAVLRSPYLVEHLQAALRIAAEPMPAPILEAPRYVTNFAKPVALDLEWNKNRISVIGYAWEQGNHVACAAYPCSGGDYAGLALFPEIIGQNLHAADLRALAKEGVNVEPLEAKVFDTMLAAHATHAHLAGTGSYDIRSLVLLLGEQQGQRFPLDWKDYEGDIYRTCREDAAAALWVSTPLKRIIAAHHLEATVAISHAVAPIFARMYERGIRLDRTVLERIHNERAAKTAETVAKYALTETRGVRKTREVPIWRSPAVLDRYEHLFGVRPPSRSRAAWQKLSENPRLSQAAREFAAALLALSQGANDAHWLGAADEDDDGGLNFEKVDAGGRIHPQYAVHGSPDRPIAKGPNIQNFPRPADDPRPTPLRAAVLPNSDEEVLIACDYSGVETYTTALEADDQDAVRAIQRGERSHEIVADSCSRIAKTELSRQQGKAVNHAFDKGESPANLARRLFGTATTTQKAACAAMYAALLAKYPATAAFRDALWERAQSNPLTVANKFGRRLQCFARSRYGEERDWDARHQPQLKHWCPCKACAPRRERWKYALAFLGRSSAVDALLRCMVRIWSERRLGAYSLPLIECHDEIVYSVPRTDAEKFRKIVLDSFEEAVPELAHTKLPASAKIGATWAACK